MTSRAYFKQLNILMGAMIAGVVFFLLVITYLIATQGPIASELHEVFQYIGPGMGFATMVMSSFLYKARLKTIPSDAPLTDKMTGYRSAKILSFALLDGGALLNAMGFFLTGHWMYLAIVGFILVIFLLARPTPQSASNDLELMGEDAMRIQNPEEIIGHSTN